MGLPSSPNQNLRQIGQEVSELWSDIKTEITTLFVLMFVYINCVEGPGMPGNRFGEGVRNLELAREEEQRRVEPNLLRGHNPLDRGLIRYTGKPYYTYSETQKVVE